VFIFCKIPSHVYYFHFLNEWCEGIDSVFEFLHAIQRAQLKLMPFGEFWYLKALLVPEIDVLFIGLRIGINVEERNNSSHMCCNLYISKYTYIFLCVFSSCHSIVHVISITDFQSSYTFLWRVLDRNALKWNLWNVVFIISGLFFSFIV